MNFSLISRFCGQVNLLIACILLVQISWCLYFDVNLNLGLKLTVPMFVLFASGIALWIVGRKHQADIKPREALMIVAYAWFLMSIIGMTPYLLGTTSLHFADAFFESVSGFTTTGSTILSDIESLPDVILFWRSFTQWIGGLGVIVLFVSIFPSLGVAGGKSLFKMEMPGPIKENITPKLRDTTRYILYTYIVFTIIETMLLVFVSQIPWFDAMTHSFTTISTGGFSIKNTSIASYHSVSAEWIIIVFMFLGGTNFGLYYLMIHGQIKAAFKDSELRFYAGIVVLFSSIIAISLTFYNGYEVDASIRASLRHQIEYHNIERLRLLRHEQFATKFLLVQELERVGIAEPKIQDIIAANSQKNYEWQSAVRKSIFQVISLITTTGFASDDYELYPVFVHMFLFYLLFCGGCAGSTAGGVKLFRILLIGKTFLHEIKTGFRPALVSKIRVGSTIISDDLIRTVLAFVGIYFACIAIGALYLGLEGHTLITALTASMTAVGNFGPGFGEIGPTENFSHFSNNAKILLGVLMLLGRLEFFTLLTFLHYRFWKR